MLLFFCCLNAFFLQLPEFVPLLTHTHSHTHTRPFLFSIIHDTTYTQFRQGVQPKWEDENCVGGGEWLLPLDTKGIKPDQAKQLMDQYWLNAMLACISGDAFGEYEEYICGVAAMIRKQPRISLWIRKTPDDKTILAIGEIFRNVVLLLDADLSDEEKRQASMFKVQFKSFADQMKFIRDPRFQIPK